MGICAAFSCSNLPLVMNRSLNKTKGGTNAVFGVDGSIVVHDMYFKSP